MGLTYTSAIAALLNNGNGKQVLPISMANLIELSKDKTNFGTGAQSVQDALSYLAGSFKHADDAAKAAQDNAYAYVGQEIGKLDVAYVGSDTDKDHNKFISYIYQEDGKIKAFAQDMSAANVAYVGSDSRATVADELQHINATIADNLTATTLSLVKVSGAFEEPAATVSADGTEYRLKQGNKTVASFNIEKDSFVKSGAVVRCKIDSQGNIDHTSSDADGNVIGDYKGEDGAYFIKLEIKTHDAATDSLAEETLYIPAESLVDAYKADNAGNNVTITIDQNKNTIGAVINEGGVGTTELAGSAVTTAKIADGNVTTAKIANSAVTAEKIAASAIITDKIATSAVTTEKIADKNVTKEKLSEAVQTSLGKADTALQQSDITTGKTAGAISVKGTDVAVNGLATVATTGAAKDVTITEITELNTIAGAGQHVDDVQEALATLAGKVKAINDGTVTSVKTNVVDNGNDATGKVTISMTPTEQKNGAVTVELTHNLGSAAALGYDEKTVATPVTEAFWNSVK